MLIVPFPSHTLWSGPRPGPRPSKKALSEILEKADPRPNFTVWVKNPFLPNLKVLISNPKK